MSRLKEMLSQAERVGVIGSPSTTSELAIDVLGTAADRKLVGEFALFAFHQDGLPHYAMGQITEVMLRNVWHEDPTMRSLIRQRGQVDAVSARQDTHLAKMTLSAVFREVGGRYEPAVLGTVPSTGTPVVLVDDAVLDELLSAYRDQLFYLGQVFGAKPKLPMWFKHFGTGPAGAGEAYHLGIFGKTGSGKSTIAKMILLAYARHPDMGILVIDPQGEFAKDLGGDPAPARFRLPMKRLVEGMGRRPYVIGVQDLVLDRWELFQQILFESPFFERLSVPKGENRRIAAEVLSERLQKARVKLEDLHTQEAFQRAWDLLLDESVQKQFYRSAGSRERFQGMLAEADSTSFYKEYWLPVAELFRKDRSEANTVGSVINGLLRRQGEGRGLYVVDLSLEQSADLFWNDTIQAMIIKRLLEELNWQARKAYEEGGSLNTLVVIDEAHRLAPRRTSSEEDDAIQGVRRVLVDAARTTRKYGLGWMFISQTLYSLDVEILQQLRIMFFGFGLALGQEYQALRQLVGSSSAALNLYQLFRDPHSAFDDESRTYSFMTVGPVSPLSFAGTPLFFNAFNRVEEFLRANGFEVG